MNFFSDSSEWKYLFRNAIDWDTIIPLYYPSFPTADGFKNKDELISFFEELLTNTGAWAGETLAPRARELDEKGPGKLGADGRFEISEVLKRTYDEASEMDLVGMTLDPKFGGMGVPFVVGLILFEQISRACMSTSGQMAFFSSMVDMLERFCDEETQKKFIPRIRAGEISGSMCLTEPGAGSDVGSLRTSAEKRDDGTYLLNGSKIFITNGVGGMGFVLARVKGAPKGLEGISLFLVEQYPQGQGGPQNYRVTRLEEKMGMHGSATCEVVYENTVAHLVGEENQGFKYMLHLMNEARVSVGMQSLGGIEAAVGYVRQYAEGRTQFGKTLVELPLYKRNLADWETERDAFRALMVDTIWRFDIFQRLDMKKRHTGDLSEDETKLLARCLKIVRHRTPLVKYYGAETYTLLSQRAIQALGGYGFMKEYDAERFHRDSFGTLLYEGTSQIQALMAMKDFVKDMMKKPGKFIQSLVASHPIAALGEDEFRRSLMSMRYEFRKNVAGLIVRCFKPELNPTERGLLETLSQVNSVFRREYWQEAGRFDKLMVHAETLCQALTYVEVLRVLAKHASKDPARGDLYHRYLKLVTPRLQSIYADWKLAE